MKPTPGNAYELQADGTLEEITALAYGDPTKESLLWEANPSITSTVVRKGEVIIIPGAPPAERLTGKSPDEMTFLVGGVEIPMVSSRVLRTMDTGADGWNGLFPWTPGENPEIDRVTLPYAYPRAAAYIGNELIVSGALYGVSPVLNGQGRSKVLTGYSFTADAIDSNVPPPYQRDGETLEQIATSFARAMGVKAVFDADGGGPFEIATASESDTVFGFLSKLATQRGLLVSCTRGGDFLFTRANKGGKPVCTLAEGDGVVTDWTADYDGRRRYHEYKCVTSGSTSAVLEWDNPDYGQGSSAGPSTIISKDNAVPRSRWQTFRADDTTPGNIENAARWKKNRQIVDALTQELPVASWRVPGGGLWEVNTKVTVVSPTLSVPKGFDFLIRAVEFLVDGGRSAVLHLVPPQAYSLSKDLGTVWTV